MSLHFFYLRIFPKKSFRIAIYIVMGITLAYGIVFILVSVFQCSPIKTAWLRWDGTAPGHCNNINLQGWTSAAINIVLDFVTLALPLRELSQMDLWRKKKIHICIMFSVGSLYVDIHTPFPPHCNIKDWRENLTASQSLAFSASNHYSNLLNHIILLVSLPYC